MPEKPTVWVVGDAMLDVTVDAKTFRESPEDPSAPVLNRSAGTVTYAAGGAANVAVNLAAQGCDVQLCAPWGERCQDALRLNRLVVNPETGIRWPSYTPSGDPWLRAPGTTTKTRYVRGGRLVARVDEDFDSEPVMPPAVIVGQKPAAVIVTDYGRGAVTKESAAEWSAFCRRFNVPVFADPKKGRTEIWNENTDLSALVLNWDEACEKAVKQLAAYTPKTFMDDPEEAVRLASHILHTTPHFGRVVVKRGVYGSVLVTHGGKHHTHISPVLPRHQVADRQGAGDTYVAALVAGIARGLEMPLACRVASAAAGVAVSRPGTAVVGLRDALEALKPVLPPDLSAKDLRTLGYTVGYTNGCFDLHLHPGHLSTLAHAASLCDFLFVGVDDDARVKKLKGDRRPVVCAADRVAQLQACRSVYKAFAFDDHEEALKSVAPAVLVKGHDWKDKGVPEAGLLEEWGGRLEFAPYVDVPHTSERLKSVEGRSALEHQKKE